MRWGSVHFDGSRADMKSGGSLATCIALGHQAPNRALAIRQLFIKFRARFLRRFQFGQDLGRGKRWTEKAISGSRLLQYLQDDFVFAASGNKASRTLLESGHHERRGRVHRENQNPCFRRSTSHFGDYFQPFSLGIIRSRTKRSGLTLSTIRKTSAPSPASPMAVAGFTHDFEIA